MWRERRNSNPATSCVTGRRSNQLNYVPSLFSYLYHWGLRLGEHRLAEGLVNKDIAARLDISEHTVKFHISSILDKLGASTRTEAVTLGIRRGLIPI